MIWIEFMLGFFQKHFALKAFDSKVSGLSIMLIMTIVLMALPSELQSQFSVVQCQSHVEALIAPDRNDWAHANLAIVNEAYLHNFEPPTLPCGMEDAELDQVIISIELLDISSIAGCTSLPLFGNVLLNCPLSTTSICPIVQDVLTPGCGFGTGSTMTGVYSLDIFSCGIGVNSDDIIGVDLVPGTEIFASCPTDGAAISSGSIELQYSVCITFVYDQDLPTLCTNTLSQSCDDGDPCTLNDEEIVEACDASIVCIPCAGTPVVSCEETVILPCDDGNDCTSGDQMTVEACDASIVCAPCAGMPLISCEETVVLSCDDGDPCTSEDQMTVESCDNDVVCVPCSGIVEVNCIDTQVLPCDDGDPCTVNDQISVSACDATLVCIPCQGESAPSCLDVISILCDDGDPCTENDLEFRDACDTELICAPCAGTLKNPENCDDENCQNGLETWDPVTCSCISTEPLWGCNDIAACNYNPLATCDDGTCDLTCQDCAGIPFGEAILDSCGMCLEREDPMFNMICLARPYVPNAFTPNGDGVNDRLQIISSRSFETFDWQVFNRLGQQVFHSSDPDVGWNGSEQKSTYFLPNDIYSYQLVYSYEGLSHQRIFGHVSLIR